jgi:hypothetical protein
MKSSKPSVITPKRTQTRASIGARGQDLRTLLDLDESFAVTSFTGFPEKDYKGSSAFDEGLKNVTTAGAILLAGGCVLWAARRLEKVADVTRCYLSAEALLCYQDSPAYVRWSAFDDYPPYGDPTNDAERAVQFTSSNLWFDFELKASNQHHLLPPQVWPKVAQVVAMVRTVLGPSGRAPFDAWLTMVLERLQEVAPNPRALARAKLKDKRFDWSVECRYEQENMGPPLPPAVLDPRHTDASDLGGLYAEFLTSVDWKKNLFLPSPEVMKERGFEDTPYVPRPRARYPKGVTLAGPAKGKSAVVAPVETPYRFLASLDAMPKAKRASALRAYVASRGWPKHFDRTELLLEHAFRLMLGRPVMEAKGLHVGILEASLQVVGDLSILVEDERPRIPVLSAFEPSLWVFDVAAVKEILAGALDERRLAEPAPVPSTDRIAIRGDDTILARVTREELATMADDLHEHVSEVHLIAPSDGTLFDTLRYMVQQEDEPWGMSNLLDASDMIVETLDGKMEAALEAVEDEALRAALSAFCDAEGRSARAWRWTGKDWKRPGEPTLRFVAGVYDGEGVGFEFNIYRVEES